jgi:hypothetical protein
MPRKRSRPGLANPAKGVSQTPWRLPALHSSRERGEKRAKAGPDASIRRDEEVLSPRLEE